MVKDGQAWGKEFPQKAELAQARENNSAVIRELQRMQDDASYVSQWTPKTLLEEEKSEAAARTIVTPMAQRGLG